MRAYYAIGNAIFDKLSYREFAGAIATIIRIAESSRSAQSRLSCHSFQCSVFGHPKAITPELEAPPPCRPNPRTNNPAGARAIAPR